MLIVIINSFIAITSFVLLWQLPHETLTEHASSLIFLSGGVQFFTLYGIQFARKIVLTRDISIYEVIGLAFIALALGTYIDSILTGCIYLLSVLTQNSALILRVKNQPIKGIILEASPRILFLLTLNFELSFIFYVITLCCLAFSACLASFAISFKAIDYGLQYRFWLGNYAKLLEGVLFPFIVPQSVLAIFIKLQSIFRPADLIFSGITRYFEIKILTSIPARKLLTKIGVTIFVVSAFILNIIVFWVKFDWLGIAHFLREHLVLFNIYALLKIIELHLGFPGIPLRKVLYNRLPMIFIRILIVNTAMSLLILSLHDPITPTQGLIVLLSTGVLRKAMSWYFLRKKVLHRRLIC